MIDLEQRLEALAEEVEWPQCPSLESSVLARLAQGSETRWRAFASRGRVTLALGLAVLAAVGALLAVPAARSALLELLGLRGVSLVRVDELPRIASGPAALGDRVTLAEAERRAGFEVRRPELGPPDGVYVARASGAVVLVYGRPVRLRVTEVPETSLFQKLLTAGTTVTRVEVGGRPAVWLSGAAHFVGDVFDQPDLAGNTLLWSSGGITYRIDGDVSKEQALALAENVRAE